MILKNFIVKLLFILIVILCLVYSATSFAIESSYIWSDSSNFEQSLKTNAPKTTSKQIKNVKTDIKNKSLH